MVGCNGREHICIFHQQVAHQDVVDGCGWSQGRGRCEVWACAQIEHTAEAGSLEPGETRELFLELPPLEPGAYELRLDLAEDDGSGDLRWFQRMGSPPFVSWIHVSATGRESEAGKRVPVPR